MSNEVFANLIRNYANGGQNVYKSLGNGEVKKFDSIAAKLDFEIKEAIKDGAKINDLIGDKSVIQTVMNAYIPLEQKKQIIDAFVANGADINTPNADGTTPVFSAKNSQELGYLKEKGANFDIQDNNGNTALMANANRLDIVKPLIENGASIYIQNKEGKDVSQIASNYDTANLIYATHNKNRLDKGEISADFADQSGTTLLIAYPDNYTKHWIEKGANVNAADNNGTTPLMTVKTAEAAKMLVEAGADINARDKDGKTALAHAFENNCSKEVIQTLLDHGADIYAQDNQGKLAYQYANNESFKLVQPTVFNDNVKNIAKEPDPTIRAQKASSIILSVTNKEQAQALVDLGADINAKYANNRTALMAAAFYGNTDAAKAFIEVGADLKAKDITGKNAMDYAQTPEMKSLLTMASVKQHTMANTPQTQSQEIPAKQSQINMAAITKSQDGR